MGPTNFTDDADCGSYFDHIDDLIEFPSENECGAGAGVGGILGPVGGEGKSFPSLWDEALPGTDNLFAGNDHLSTDLSAQLSVPYEDIVHLEWLSTFVEDSFSCGGMTLGKENPIVKKEFPSNQYQTENLSSQFQMSSPVSVLESSSSTSSSSSSSGGKAILLSSNQQRGAQRARSKRPRPATFNPRLVMQHLALPPPPPFMPTGVFTEPENYAESEVANRFMNPPVAEEPKKKMKKIKFTAPPSYNMEMDENQQSLPVRKCLHCEITKTPQWRAGPLGPKTLCNACGVRYKSGRLFPEYRPAASPTFVPAVHSNSHKKVLEMRGTVIVNEKGKDGVVGTAAKTYIPSQRDSVPVLAPAQAPVPVPVPTPFPVPEIKPKLEYM